MKLVRSVAFVAVAAIAPVAFAGSVADAITSLKDAITARKTATPAPDEKQLKALDKCLKTMEKDQTELGDAIKVEGKVAKTLEKAFATDFGGAAGQDDFSDYVGDVVGQITDALNSLKSTQQSAIDAQGFDAKAKEKAQKSIDKATAALAAASEATTSSLKLKALAKANKALVKAQKIIDAATPSS